MANQIYAKFCNIIGQGLVDFANDVWRVALIDTSVYTRDVSDTGHETIGDIPNGGILSEARLTGVTWAARIFDAANFVNNFPDHGGGLTGEQLVIYQESLFASPVNITAVNQGTKKFTVDGPGDINSFNSGKLIEVAGSTGNNGEYNIKSRTDLGGGSYDVEVYEAIPSAVADGTITSSRPGSYLFLNLDTVGGLPVTLDGSDDSITWDAAGIWEFAVSCP